MAILKGPGEPKSYDGSNLRIGIIHARWNTTIIDALLAGTKQALAQSGVKEENIVIQSVPGSYELPYAVKQLYSASQVQSSSSGVVGAAADLLGSTSDLTKLPGGDAGTSTAPFDAIIAIGVLIKGETMHFEYIADAVSHGLMRLQLDGNVPVIFGLLTLLSEEQGLYRAGIAGKGKNEGHNHGNDWGSAAVELGVKRKGWVEGNHRKSPSAISVPSQARSVRTRNVGAGSDDVGGLNNIRQDAVREVGARGHRWSVEKRNNAGFHPGACATRLGELRCFGCSGALVTSGCRRTASARGRFWESAARARHSVR
ncbi:hypothetical protein OPT61_g2532 [Boeremia exigua]|uniref:Uncharacterized protein n=1 Tax=Boeremia exigua TaxID=749465 RepID=A0ACC2IL79_9PLEO|nr:hypothetical protein OPT61_g2532 [Boeremia exigua]